MYSTSIRKAKKAFITNRLLFVPSTLANIPAFLTSLGYETYFIEHHQDKVAYILHKILESATFDPNFTSGGYSNLNQKHLEEMLGPKYTQTILRILLDSGVIECDGQYIPKKKSLGYRVANQYKSTAIGLSIFKQEVLGKKLDSWSKAQKKAIKKCCFLKSVYQDIKDICINTSAATALITSIYNQTTKFIKSNIDSLSHRKLDKKKYAALQETAKTERYINLPSIKALRKSLKKQSNSTIYELLMDSAMHSYNANIISINEIGSQDFRMPKRPIEGSRIYTVLTNLSRELRQFLYHAKYPNESLVNIDIKNSQPFLASILLVKQYEGWVLPADVQRYIELTSKGIFYNYMAGLMHKPYNTQKERKDFKQSFFANIFFCKQLHTENSKAGKIFQSYFPNVSSLLSLHKEKCFKDLALTMQYTEAQIMLDTIVKSLQKNKIWCASIHDSIVCLKRDKDFVTNVILDAFRNKFNLVPSVDEELWIRPEM
ncbi:hypothetical protein H8B15_08470 [Hymenobacter sp. BT507]|uniref:DNA-directed DNA polymerase family A palm domain-containing protein n=1 Tax=Hymenobacter citatus TaxID=2763506 RepID=A0ABR7MIN3_9BACT|nr:hypothetical protein [Hymenobacter citatus]MBC6610955.1 hypothetical protein [Hymenobacter citatus]